MMDLTGHIRKIARYLVRSCSMLHYTGNNILSKSIDNIIVVLCEPADCWTCVFHLSVQGVLRRQFVLQFVVQIVDMRGFPLSGQVAFL